MMQARPKLIQCFSCKNNLNCWGLVDSVQSGRNEREFYPDHEKLMKLINKFPENGPLNIAEYYGMISALFMQALRFDRVVIRRDVYQLISLLCALCNVESDTWFCPGEINDSDEKWIYEGK